MGFLRDEVLRNTLHDEKGCLHQMPGLLGLGGREDGGHLLERSLGATDEHNILDELLHSLSELVKIFTFHQYTLLQTPQNILKKALLKPNTKLNLLSRKA